MRSRKRNFENGFLRGGYECEFFENKGIKSFKPHSRTYDWHEDVNFERTVIDSPKFNQIMY
jgi:hypothetical protein